VYLFISHEGKNGEKEQKEKDKQKERKERQLGLWKEKNKHRHERENTRITKRGNEERNGTKGKIKKLLKRFRC
jgi:hypothetical protein